MTTRIVVLAFFLSTFGCSDDNCPMEDPRGDLGIEIRATAGVVESIDTAGACAGSVVTCLGAKGFQPGCETYQLGPQSAGECTLTIHRKGKAPLVQAVHVTDHGTSCHGYRVLACSPHAFAVP